MRMQTHTNDGDLVVYNHALGVHVDHESPVPLAQGALVIADLRLRPCLAVAEAEEVKVVRDLGPRADAIDLGLNRIEHALHC